MKKPFMGALRRTYHPALWLQYRQSDHHTHLAFRVHRLQVLKLFCVLGCISREALSHLRSNLKNESEAF